MKFQSTDRLLYQAKRNKNNYHGQRNENMLNRKCCNTGVLQGELKRKKILPENIKELQNLKMTDLFIISGELKIVMISQLRRQKQIVIVNIIFK